jgi:hypothetical protein
MSNDFILGTWLFATFGFTGVVSVLLKTGGALAALRTAANLLERCP